MNMFNTHNSTDFVMFSTSHFLALILLVLLVFSLYFFKAAIRSNDLLKKWIKYLIIGALVIPELCLYIWNTDQSLWDVTTSLPLELCSFTQLISIIMLVKPIRILYPFVFFAGIGGAMQAMITPNLQYAFPHFIFFYFFITHISIILAPFYLTWIEHYRPTWKSIGVTMVLLNICVLFVGIINLILNSNYMFLMHKPYSASILDILGEYPYYLISEEFLALFIFVFMYSFFLFKSQKV
ncbi:TIGR02206 family membrane protein [Paenibacillus psychroresistens]|uniref:TIGR02206 family membrane protein n=1 Tax=Paenibacillus psychroresistens TaxID=1778678 RepID=A0A6B8RJL1_9BACL|nr:TIGR02206 family membrane protein [Paenibacillus psychroresistens]QGQ95914.1 TIGR02206 family membrane protein [Paenibacillus psychroresistens]